MKTLWFRAKRYGYGWFPITWQGWLLVIGYILVALGDACFLSVHPESNTIFISFLAILVVATILLFWICSKTGEPLRWHWGDKK